jgi:hypothetical protein
MPRTHLLALPLVAALVLPASASATLKVGVSDQHPATFASPFYRQAKLTVARYIVPFDATSDPEQNAKAEAWLRAADAAGQRVLVSFEHSRKSSSAAARLPSATAYQKAITAFKARFGRYVDDVSPWNEVNRRFDPRRGEGQPTWNRPDIAARYYGIARKVFRGKPIVALDVLDENNVNPAVSYIRRFKAAVKKQHLPAPRIWGLHPYSDINRFSTSRTKRMLAATGKGEVWLTEASGIVAFGKSFPYSEQRAAAANKCMFTIAKLDRRIKRLYVFGWTAGGAFDAGLVAPDGQSTRPGFTVVQRRTAGRCQKPRGVR